MAGAELAGMGSLEDILMDAASEESIAESNVISDNGSTIVHTSFTEAGTLGLEEKSESPQIYAIDMDISETMGTLKSRAAEALHIDLLNFKVTVLSEKQLSDSETLQQQCGTDSGLVQIQFVLRSDTQGDRLDILDVLKPNEGMDTEESKSAVTVPSRTIKNSPIENRPTSSKVPKTTRWIVCPTFKELQKCLKIPQNPLEWSVANVRQWLSWAVCQFGLTDINLNGCTINGPALFNLSQTDFRKLIPEDPGDVFYMHFELLRRTNVVAVVCDPNSSVPRPAPPKALFTSTPRSVSTSTIESCKSGEREVSSSSSSSRNSGVVSSSSNSSNSSSSGISSSNITSNSSLVGTNGTQQIQLWQFLLEMLTDPKLYPIMSWCGSEGEFRLHQPEVVANLWGQRKSKPNMNYEKLSRALRYYYDGDMIAKVSGKRFVYRFVLDLKSVVGYSADELRQQVEECAVRDGLNLESVAGATLD